MFWKKNKDKQINVYAPCDGTVISLEKVKDSVFSAKILGDGLAIMPTSEAFYAPISGDLEVFFPTGHAFGIKESSTNIEVLIHIGLETATSKVKLYEKKAQINDKVQANKTYIVKALLNDIKKNKYDIVTPIIVTSNTIESFPKFEIKYNVKFNTKVNRGDLLFTITL